MLILTRGVDESIIIGDDVIVTVVEFRGNKVRLGIAAPPEVEVDRTEVRDAKVRGAWLMQGRRPGRLGSEQR